MVFTNDEQTKDEHDKIGQCEVGSNFECDKIDSLQEDFSCHETSQHMTSSWNGQINLDDASESSDDGK